MIQALSKSVSRCPMISSSTSSTSSPSRPPRPAHPPRAGSFWAMGDGGMKEGEGGGVPLRRVPPSTVTVWSPVSIFAPKLAYLIFFSQRSADEPRRGAGIGPSGGLSRWIISLRSVVSPPPCDARGQGARFPVGRNDKRREVIGRGGRRGLGSSPSQVRACSAQDSYATFYWVDQGPLNLTPSHPGHHPTAREPVWALCASVFETENIIRH